MNLTTQQEAQLREALERLVDARGLENVLELLAMVCSEKADHIRTSYSDNALADRWDNACNRLCAVACHAEGL